MVPFKGELSVFANLSPITTAGAVRSATLATAGLLVTFLVPAQPGSPGQNPEGCKMVVVVLVAWIGEDLIKLWK